MSNRIGFDLRLVHLKRAALVLLLVLALLVSGHRITAARDFSVGLLVGVQGLGDQSYNDMTYAGLVRARQTHGTPLLMEHTGSEAGAIEAGMKRLIDGKVDIIVANGFYFSSVVNTYARQFPDRFFIIQDAIIEDLPNVAAVTYAVEEGSFLVGALAALVTKTGKCAFLGGVDVPIMQPFRRGFEQGVQHIDPKLSVWSDFISTGPDFSGFNNPAKAFDIAMKLYGSEVDIIYAAAGVSGNGVMRAALKSGRYAIGVDSDQDYMAKGQVLTSMMKRLDVTTFEEVDKIVKGKFKPGVKRYGLKAGGIGLTEMKYTRHLISQENLTHLEAIKKEIIAGQIAITP